MDVNTESFQQAVLDRSKQQPVVVDFWASWCGPCRQLAPVLERELEPYAGKIDLVKVDTDANQELASRYGIQGIPAVKAFKDGEVVAEFVGAQSPPAVAQFLKGLVPSEAELLAAAGDEQSLRAALELEPTRADAAVPLARILHARGEDEQALSMLAEVPGSFAADGLAARIELERSAADPHLADAFARLDAGDRAGGLALLLDAIAAPDAQREPLRRAVVGVLAELEPGDELARTARRRLASLLY